MKVINAEGKVLGRLASEVAEIARDGEEVAVVNSSKAVISGDEKNVKEKYQQKYERGRRDTGPYYPKRADKILKRTIRNMLPFKESDGREQFKNVKTYLGIPERMEEEVEEAEAKEGDDLKHRNYVKLGEVSEFIGGAE
ncbi:50S ribosomal protein L13 [Candidatus Nanohalobium constans]|uniref:Large ribosomal subunit protein uL13 n=1 Tax=Candidatus Nanohalobium constans TaxID=2565781 RepID=A0A5Q0UHU8_9ARCH|nr:50S ribosomal protein L13 [Candidatus Nanohalobium constans]QGA80921.1 50S ribosomal protein L13 [Candidatus Nanohalobium constans]